MILSMDALFGLPRKKAAGHSYAKPLHGDLFFGNQEEVDKFVSSYHSLSRSKEGSKVVVVGGLKVVPSMCLL